MYCTVLHVTGFLSTVLSQHVIISHIVLITLYTSPEMYKLTKEIRISLVILISTSFFLLELIIGFRNHSLALVADAFHVASDLIGFGVALYAIRLQRRTKTVPMELSFGWQRAELLGAFFNGGP